MSPIPQVQTHQSIDALVGTLLALGVICVTLRLYACHLQRASLGADDYFMVLSILSFAGLAGAIIYGTTHRVIGYPHRTPGATSTESYAKAVIAFDMMSEACMGLVKLSVLCFYRRTFCIKGHWDWFNIAVDVWIVLVSLWTVAFFILPPLECGTHFSSLWTSFDAKEFCTIGYYWLISQSSSDLFFEITILAMPIPRIWLLHTTSKRRMAITLVFLTALASLGPSVARLIIFVRTQHEEAAGKVEDGNLSNTELMWMIVLEDGMALVAANLPTLWFLHIKMVSPGKVLRSMRSAVSLSSIRSRSSKDSQKNKNSRDASASGGEHLETGRSSDHGRIAHAEAASSLSPDTGASHKCHISHGEERVSEEDLSSGRITVKKQFDRHVSEAPEHADN